MWTNNYDGDDDDDDADADVDDDNFIKNPSYKTNGIPHRPTTQIPISQQHPSVSRS